MAPFRAALHSTSKQQTILEINPILNAEKEPGEQFCILDLFRLQSALFGAFSVTKRQTKERFIDYSLIYTCSG